MIEKKLNLFNLKIFFNLFLSLILFYSLWKIFSYPSLNLSLDLSDILRKRELYADNFDWLKHLLFYNQTCTNCTGDFFLVRLAFFFYDWFIDVFFRSNRLFQYLFSILVSVFSGFILFIVLKSYVNLSLSILLTTLFFVYSENYFIFKNLIYANIFYHFLFNNGITKNF